LLDAVVERIATILNEIWTFSVLADDFWFQYSTELTTSSSLLISLGIGWEGSSKEKV
jgi:hypothetical protein